MTAIVGNDINQSFTYNGNGNRLSKTVDGETTYFVNDLNQRYEQVVQTYNDEGIIDTYTYGLQRINSKGETNETYLYDGRGSVVGAVGNGNDFVSYSYTAYGELMPNSPTPTVFGYNAEATDFKTGMQYLRARYYDTSLGRFFQEDDYRGKFTKPSSMNRYAYIHNNPVIGIDPSGYIAEDDLDDALDAYYDAKALYDTMYTYFGNETRKLTRLKDDKAGLVSDAKSVSTTLSYTKYKLSTLKWYYFRKKKETENTIARLEQERYNLNYTIGSYNGLISNQDIIVAQMENKVQRLYEEKEAAYANFLKVKDEWNAQYKIDQEREAAIDAFLENELPIRPSSSWPSWSYEEYIDYICGLSANDIEGLRFENGFPVLFQNDGQPWSRIDFSNNANPKTTVSSSACSAVSMAIAMYMFTGNYTPYEAIEYALGKSEFGTESYRAGTSSGIDTDYFTDYAAEYDITTQNYSGGYSNYSNSNRTEAEEALIEAINNGGTAVVRTAKTSKYTDFGHYIAVVGYETSIVEVNGELVEQVNFIVHDPNYYNQVKNNIMGEGAMNTFEDIYDDTKNIYILDPNFNGD